MKWLQIEQIQTEVRSCDVLCLWLDCDREGENIAFEVIDCVKKVKRNIHVLRAHFSALIPSDIWAAVRNLTPPDENQAKAADARQEIDLRIGCAFSRFQTMLLRHSVPEIDSLVSYGPCQFPTLGFVVERYLQREVLLLYLFICLFVYMFICLFVFWILNNV